MDRKSFFNIFFFIFVMTVIYLTYSIFRPFITPIFMAAMLAILFYPLHTRIKNLTRRGDNLCALITTVLIALIIIIPLIYFLFVLSNELAAAYDALGKALQHGDFLTLENLKKHPLLKSLIDLINQYADLSKIDLESVALDLTKKVSTFAATQTKKFFAGFALFVFNLFATLLTLFFFFRDGSKFVEWIRNLLPLTEEQKAFILDRLKELINASIRAGLVLSLLQGALGGLIFWILGVGQPLLWCALMAVLSWLPVVGAWLVWGPVAVYFLLTGSLGKGIILILWGSMVIGLVDNFLRPFLISGRTSLNTILIFFSALGGIKVFGVVGLVLGPMVVVLFLALVEIVHQWSLSERETGKQPMLSFKGLEDKEN